jgi:hypothetical protein
MNESLKVFNIEKYSKVDFSFWRLKNIFFFVRLTENDLKVDLRFSSSQILVMDF